MVRFDAVVLIETLLRSLAAVTVRQADLEWNDTSSIRSS
ncbi:hypothetical protein PAMC26510_18045 [Caballeronia sordidicola]|uniref:Uncharacterized protein n=1 Tax=Caballeronia sordidicola TaxID=196367 RepID=A0A242MR34_CABSO|nr:hypothetical protein PAMC26510_18045 [Caballeronia sordidicola]